VLLHSKQLFDDKTMLIVWSSGSDVVSVVKPNTRICCFYISVLQRFRKLGGRGAGCVGVHIVTHYNSYYTVLAHSVCVSGMDC
jgi:hypothetical protein